MKKLALMLPLVAALGGCAAIREYIPTSAELKADAAFACGLEPRGERIATALSQNPWVQTGAELASIVCGR